MKAASPLAAHENADKDAFMWPDLKAGFEPVPLPLSFVRRINEMNERRLWRLRLYQLTSAKREGKQFNSPLLKRPPARVKV